MDIIVQVQESYSGFDMLSIYYIQEEHVQCRIEKATR